MKKLQALGSRLQRGFKPQAASGKPNCLKFDQGGFSGLWTSLLCLLAVVALSSSPLFAQTNVAKAPSRASRYLFVIETSRSMEKRSEGTLKAAQGLLVSAMSGQLRRGDTLGVWTFNDELYAGQLPLQKWSPEGQKQIANRT